MDQMIPSPYIPSLGTPHHALEEDAMINPQAMSAQQNKPSGASNSGPNYSFGGGFTPQNLLTSPAPGMSSHHSSSATPSAQSKLIGHN